MSKMGKEVADGKKKKKEKKQMYLILILCLTLVASSDKFIKTERKR